MLINENIATARKDGARLLLVNSLECRTHLEYMSGDLKAAQGALATTQAVALDPSSPLRDVFFVEKWRILIAYRAKPSIHWLREARALQSLARDHRDFETARAIDFHLGRELKDPKRLTQVYYGSPFPSYRRRIEETAKGIGIEIPDTYLWQPSPSGRFPSPPVDITHAAPLRGLIPKLLNALCADHYRPQPLLALHERLYPGNHFSPTSSRDQMHQAFKRLRGYLSSHSLALDIHERKGTYSLAGAQRLILHRRSDADARIRVARKRLGDHEEFASSLFASRMNISKPTAVSILREWTSAGAVTRAGAGPGTKYKFVTQTLLSRYRSFN
ncbi:hypothetical protein WDW86_04430 [Bdellovibrionota bacterium FG-2]